jgi:hypothetical protein
VLESVTPPQDTSLGAISFDPNKDHELNGDINRASAQGANFALLLAMLEPDLLQRPHLAKDSKPDTPPSSPPTTVYPAYPLKAGADDWCTVTHTSSLIQSGHLQSANLWLTMHPEPLSQYNDPKLLYGEVMANCSLPTQTRIRGPLSSTLGQDETGLYDILQSLDASFTAAV